MEVISYVFDPPEPMNTGESLANAFNRRVMRAFSWQTTFPDEYYHDSPVPENFISSDRKDSTHTITLEIGGTDAHLVYQRRKKTRSISHVILDDTGGIIKRSGKYRIPFPQERYAIHGLGIAQRVSQDEIYLQRYICRLK